ncbi:MAG: ABC transporter ATP-binding protein [Thermodesulfovibrio sp.]|nr:ABC transporter ATP-binding protein [Thermodesulfovibrio sp. N1]MDI6715175.1 ABC transporter ATP-binding protein [Thermodesulfovibrio sp.]ODA45210.1 Iron-sulfur cluster assembly ATPase protein SufC [Thermodesulfovibrio sp. N1]
MIKKLQEGGIKMAEMLRVKNLHVSVEGRKVLEDINFSIDYGEIAVLFGPNGAGKTTLIMTLMGFPKYKIEKGKIIFKGVDITHMDVSERAKLGMGISFQRPPVVRGVSLRKLLKIVGNGKTDEELLHYAEKLNLTNHLDRDVNDGFSGGEVKRAELLQLLMQKPELVFIDEPESGVDLENIVLIGEMTNHLLGRDQRVKDVKRSAIVITHTGYILDYINADKGYILYNGKLMCKGNPRDILSEIKKNGYRRCATCQ